MVEYNGVCGVCHTMDYPPDFIVIDINMPSGDGYFMAKSITDQLTFRYCIPFVFMTASAVPETRKNGLSMGALEVLEKPFEPDDLIRIIDKFT